jgi:glycosyltransferase involved in cell wall biosynthesis
VRLAFVVYGGLDELSGGFIYDRSLVAALREDGVEVDEVALPWPDGPAAAALQDLMPLPCPRPIECYDAVIEDELGHPSLLRRNEALRRAGVPVVALVHNLGGRDEPARAIERRYLLGVDGVVAVCRHTLAEVRALCASPLGSSAAAGALAARTLVLPPGRDHLGADDPAAVAARASGRGPLRVLFVGAIAPHKGLHRLLDAWPAGLAARLDVVGPLTLVPAYVAELRASIAARGIGDRVTFRGILRGPALEAAYAEADVLVLPSEREAYPLVVLEAMGFGVPSLVTSVGGAGELVEDGVSGWLLDPTTPGPWIDRLRALADRAPRARAMLARVAPAARARHAAHGSWRQAGRAFRAFVDGDLLRAPSLPRGERC